MSAPVNTPADALAAVDGDRKAKRAIRCIEDGKAPSPDHLLHEIQCAIAVDGAYLKPTPRLRAFMRAIAKRLEGAR